jgi:hypothetical protein
MLYIGLSNFAPTSHIDILGNKLILLRIYNRISMNRNQNLVALAVDTYAVVEILELVARRELHVDVFADT